MNNEPVAWIDKNTGKPRMEGFIQTDHDIPLYTHPVNPYQSITNTKIEPTVVSYTHPVKEQDVKYNVTVKWDDKITHHKNVSVDTPLHYTHPVKEQDTECQYCKQGCIRCDARKQLTDEEITACMGFLPKYNSEIVDEDLVNFARAILRKAQQE